ncbi:MAG TPA: hypothetical protein VJI75_04040 [Candidatus Nanoarchaeia archaeon]|nr:hypothetical protein [Candidatus Nanoarchaeia archaeon]
MALITFILIGVIILGALAVFLAFRSLNNEIVPESRWFRYRAFAILLLVIGYIVHNIGDFLSQSYGSNVELSIESVAHVIILIAFILFLYSARQVLGISRQYGFR